MVGSSLGARGTKGLARAESLHMVGTQRCVERMWANSRLREVNVESQIWQLWGLWLQGPINVSSELMVPCAGVVVGEVSELALWLELDVRLRLKLPAVGVVGVDELPGLSPWRGLDGKVLPRLSPWLGLDLWTLPGLSPWLGLDLEVVPVRLTLPAVGVVVVDELPELSPWLGLGVEALLGLSPWLVDGEVLPGLSPWLGLDL